MDFFVVAESRGCSLVAIPRLLIVVTSLCAQRGLQGAWASVVDAPRLGCPTACGISLNQESNPHSLCWQVDS